MTSLLTVFFTEQSFKSIWNPVYKKFLMYCTFSIVFLCTLRSQKFFIDILWFYFVYLCPPSTLSWFLCKVEVWVQIYLFVYFTYECSVGPTSLLKGLLFLDGVALYLCQKSIDHILVNLFVDSLFCFLDVFFYTFTNSTLSHLF